jgi:hypothetical protein
VAVAKRRSSLPSADEPEIAAMLKGARKYEARKKGVELLPDKGTSRSRSSRRSSSEI